MTLYHPSLFSPFVYVFQFLVVNDVFRNHGKRCISESWSTSKDAVDWLFSNDTERRMFVYTPVFLLTFTQGKASFTALVVSLLLSVSRVSITST